MIRKTLLAAATAIVLGAGFVGVGGVAAPTQAQAQWRDYDRPYYGQRRYYREREYRPRRPAYAPRQGYRAAPAPGPRSGYVAPGHSGVLPNGRTYYTPPGQQLPNGQSYETPGGRPNAQRDNGYN